jgi:hypothetical protein
MKIEDIIRNHCPKCESPNVSWHIFNRNIGPASDGKLRVNEVRTVFILGCNDCSYTIKIIPPEKIADILNAYTKDKNNE